MAGAHAAGANFKSADLSRVYADNADLHQSNLEDADLSHADLRKANLSSSDLRNADLTWALMDSRTTLTKANLEGAILNNTRLGSADYKKTVSFENSKFQDPRCPEGYEYVHAHFNNGKKVKPYCRRKGVNVDGSERIEPFY